MKRRKTISYDITYMWNLKHGTDELLYKTETDSQRTDLGLPRGKKGKRGKDKEFQEMVLG